MNAIAKPKKKHIIILLILCNIVSSSCKYRQLGIDVQSQVLIIKVGKDYIISSVIVFT